MSFNLRHHVVKFDLDVSSFVTVTMIGWRFYRHISGKLHPQFSDYLYLLFYGSNETRKGNSHYHYCLPLFILPLLLFTSSIDPRRTPSPQKKTGDDDAIVVSFYVPCPYNMWLSTISDNLELLKSLYICQVPPTNCSAVN